MFCFSLVWKSYRPCFLLVSSFWRSELGNQQIKPYSSDLSFPLSESASTLFLTQGQYMDLVETAQRLIVYIITISLTISIIYTTHFYLHNKIQACNQARTDEQSDPEYEITKRILSLHQPRSTHCCERYLTQLHREEVTPDLPEDTKHQHFVHNG